jgi:hypothetical protein
MPARLFVAAFVAAAVLGCDAAQARRGGFLSALIRGGTHAAASSPHSVMQSPSPSIAAKTYGPDTLTVAQLEQCVASAVDLDDGSEALETRSQAIDSEKAALEAAQANLAADKARVNTRSKASVDAFNRRLDALNARIETFNAGIRTYKQLEITHNQKVAAYNGACAKKYHADDMNAVQQKLGLKE